MDEDPEVVFTSRKEKITEEEFDTSGNLKKRIVTETEEETTTPVSALKDEGTTFPILPSQPNTWPYQTYGTRIGGGLMTTTDPNQYVTINSTAAKSDELAKMVAQKMSEPQAQTGRVF